MLDHPIYNQPKYSEHYQSKFLFFERDCFCPLIKNIVYFQRRRDIRLITTTSIFSNIPDISDVTVVMNYYVFICSYEEQNLYFEHNICKNKLICHWRWLYCFSKYSLLSSMHFRIISMHLSEIFVQSAWDLSKYVSEYIYDFLVIAKFIYKKNYYICELHLMVFYFPLISVIRKLVTTLD